MGVKLMTGATGEQNIEAADDRECLAGITGHDSYVFDTGSKLKAALVDANTVTIGTGAGSLQGSRFRCPTTTTVTIKSGTQGQFRRDVIGLRFSRETSGRESMEFQVLTGEPAASDGAAADPAYTAGDLLKGDAEAFMPLYRVKLSGINASDPEPMFSVLTPLATLGAVSLYDTQYWSVVRVGMVVLVKATEIVTEADSWATLKCPYTVPEELRPKKTWQAPMTVGNGGSTTRMLRVTATGAIEVFNYGSTGSRNVSNGMLVYPIGM